MNGIQNFCLKFLKIFENFLEFTSTIKNITRHLTSGSGIPSHWTINFKVSPSVISISDNSFLNVGKAITKYYLIVSYLYSKILNGSI